MWNKHSHLQMPNRLFQVFFFPSTLNDWFNLDLNIRNSDSISIFKSRLLYFIRPGQTNIYNIFDPKGLTFLTHLRLGLSHLNEHRFQQNFQDCLNSLCSCSLEIEDTSHYLLHFHHFSYHKIHLWSFWFYAWQCQRRFTFIQWLTIWWKQIYSYFETNYKLYKKYWKIPWIPFWLMFHYWLMSNF